MEDKTKNIKRIYTTYDNPPHIPSSGSSCKAVHSPAIVSDPLGTKKDKNVFARCMKRMTRCVRPVKTVKTNRGANFDRNTFSTNHNYEESLCIIECPKDTLENKTYFPQNEPCEKRDTGKDSLSNETMSRVNSCIRREKKVIVQHSRNSQKTTENLLNEKSCYVGSGTDTLEMSAKKSFVLPNTTRPKKTCLTGDVIKLDKNSCLADMALRVLAIDEEREISSAGTSYNHSFESETIKDEDNLENDLRLAM